MSATNELKEQIVDMVQQLCPHYTYQQARMIGVYVHNTTELFADVARGLEEFEQSDEDTWEMLEVAGIFSVAMLAALHLNATGNDVLTDERFVSLYDRFCGVNQTSDED